jgi:hypothetical protein
MVVTPRYANYENALDTQVSSSRHTHTPPATLLLLLLLLLPLMLLAGNLLQQLPLRAVCWCDGRISTKCQQVLPTCISNILH